MKKLLFFWEELKATFWFVPSLLIFGAFLLSFGALWVDNQISLSTEHLRYVFMSTSVDSVRTVLSTIAGAMISVTGTVFSITLAILTLTSSQFGSRLIKNFMYVRLNQVVLGAYLSTYIYCLLILNAVRGDTNAFVPAISVIIALLLAILNIILLIFFIHHVATSIQVNKVISDISDSLDKDVKVLFPEKMGKEPDEPEKWDEKAEKAKYKFQTEISSRKRGYLQYLDSEALMHLVQKHNYLLQIYIRPGAHVVSHFRIATIHSQEKISDEMIDQIMGYFIFGRTRLARQDIEFSVLQMVEIAVRALSPGINDPNTAIMCIDNLKATLCELVQVKFPSKYRVDEEGTLRIMVERVFYESVLDTAFHQIRHNATDSITVLTHLMEALTVIHQYAITQNQKEAILKHARLVWNAGQKAAQEQADLQALRELAQRLLDEL